MTSEIVLNFYKDSVHDVAAMRPCQCFGASQADSGSGSSSLRGEMPILRVRRCCTALRCPLLDCCGCVKAVLASCL